MAVNLAALVKWTDLMPHLKQVVHRFFQCFSGRMLNDGGFVSLATVDPSADLGHAHATVPSRPAEEDGVERAAVFEARAIF